LKPERSPETANPFLNKLGQQQAYLIMKHRAKVCSLVMQEPYIPQTAQLQNHNQFQIEILKERVKNKL